MGNLAVTPSQVQPVAGGAVLNGYMGEHGVAGESVYFDAAANKWKLESADLDTNAATLAVLQATAAKGQPCTLLTLGDIDLGVDAGVVEGEVYVQSPTPGKMCPVHDDQLVAGMKVKVIGVGGPDNTLKVKPHSTDAQIQ